MSERQHFGLITKESVTLSRQPWHLHNSGNKTGGSFVPRNVYAWVPEIICGDMNTTKEYSHYPQNCDYIR